MNRIMIVILATMLFSVASLRAQATDALPESGSMAEAPPAATGAVAHTAKDDAPAVKGLSWLEISTFSPGLHPVDDAFVKRMEATWHLKLRAFRRNAQFAALCSFDPTLKAAWKKIATECKRIIKG